MPKLKSVQAEDLTETLSPTLSGVDLIRIIRTAREIFLANPEADVFTCLLSGIVADNEYAKKRKLVETEARQMTPSETMAVFEAVTSARKRAATHDKEGQRMDNDLAPDEG